MTNEVLAAMSVKKRRPLHPIPIFDRELLSTLLKTRGINQSWIHKIWMVLLSCPGFNQFIPPTEEDQPSDPTAPMPTHKPFDDAVAWRRLEQELSRPDWKAPDRLIPLLKANCALLTSRVIVEQTSSDRSTTKLIVELQDKEVVEAVVLRHRAKAVPHSELNQEEEDEQPKKQGRVSLCFSSQIGCKMACSFCATGTIGLKGSLHSGEILEQFIHANRRAPVRNAIAMGEGEPLDNYDALIDAVRAMTNQQLFHLSPNRITISTVGIIPNMYKMMYDAPAVQLALSLHAATQETRLELVPSAAAHRLDALMRCIDDYIDMMKKSVLIEYCIIADVNDSDEDAKLLAELLVPRMPYMLLNLIPYNPTTVIAQYRAPTRERVLTFQRIVQSYGVFVSVRIEMGQDIDGACGQLAIKVRPKPNTTVTVVADIEDIATRSKKQAKPRSLRRDRMVVKANPIEIDLLAVATAPQTIQSTSASTNSSIQSASTSSLFYLILAVSLAFSAVVYQYFIR